MSSPIIAITVGRQNLSAPRRQVQDVWTGCHIDYVNSILRSGGAPVLLPYLADQDVIAAALEVADGVLLPGGGDVVSLRYGEEPHPKEHYHNPARDEMEFEVVQLALEKGLPILGICRGVQVLNVALGGTLVQDVPSEVEGAVKHFSHGLAPVLLHNVDIEEGSLLAQILGATSLAVNSWHHQAVRDLGRGLRVNCRSRDGVIEGVESDEGKPILGVQCHPEEVAAIYPQFQPLFDWLVEQAKA